MHHIICEGGLEGWTRQQNLIQLAKRPDEPEHRAIMQHTVIKERRCPKGAARFSYNPWSLPQNVARTIICASPL